MNWPDRIETVGCTPPRARQEPSSFQPFAGGLGNGNYARVLEAALRRNRIKSLFNRWNFPNQFDAVHGLHVRADRGSDCENANPGFTRNFQHRAVFELAANQGAKTVLGKPRV